VRLSLYLVQKSGARPFWHWDVTRRTNEYIRVRPGYDPDDPDPDDPPPPTISVPNNISMDIGSRIQTEIDKYEQRQRRLDWFSPGDLVTVLGGTIATVGVGYAVYRLVRGAAGGAVIYFTAGVATPVGWAIIVGP
jgi:hypothetical protein